MSLPLDFITKRDGRLVPFEADKISRALFRATEGLGQPDAFLAHELTDGILHFLAAEMEGGVPTTVQVAEIVGKVVRELGQPALAQAFLDHPRKPTVPANEAATPGPAASIAERGIPWSEMAPAIEASSSSTVLRHRLASTVLRAYSLRSVFTPDLTAAHRDGLLFLGNLDSPLELASAVLEPAAGNLTERIVQASDCVGERLAIDGPEYSLAGNTDPAAAAADFNRELRRGLEMTNLNAVVNLNGASPPRWTEELAEGPLFGDRPSHSSNLATICDAVLDRLLMPRPAGSFQVRVDWHLGERDFAPEGAARLQRVVRRALEGGVLAFVFDRPRRSVALAEGLDRLHSATLLTVGLNLPALVERLADDSAEFLHKLANLVRMALSAGSQKRDFLRRQTVARPSLAQGFRLDRARLVLAPLGLDWVARRLARCGLAQGSAGAEFGRAVVRRIEEVVAQDRQSRHLEACLDGPACFALAETDRQPSLEAVAGLTSWDREATPRQQLRAASLLHDSAKMGTAAVLIGETPPSPEEAAALLHHAWQKTDGNRLRFVRTGSEERQLTATWGQ